MADPSEQRWGQRPATVSGDQNPPRLPPGYRWIAVRPGAAPPPRRGRRPLGPTPRYTGIPRWGLADHFYGPFESDAELSAGPQRGPSARLVRTVLVGTAVAMGLAVFIHIVRYALLLVNRTVLLNPLLAGAVTWLGAALSVVTVFAVVGSAVVLTNWLIARRSLAYAIGGTADPRPPLQLRAGCLIPLVNVLWAPVFVMELAGVESRITRLRRRIVLWWCVWALSNVLMVWAVATSFTRDPQGIADNTVTTIIAYLAGLAALVLAGRVVLGFELNPVDRPAKRWVAVAGDLGSDIGSDIGSDSAPGPTEPVPPEGNRESAVPVEADQREPAA